MPLRAAAVLRTLLVATALAGAAGARWGSVACADVPAAPAPANGPPGGSAARPPRGAHGDAPAGHDRGRREPDQDLIDHLDVIQDLELLQNLDLFDTGAPDGK